MSKTLSISHGVFKSLEGYFRSHRFLCIYVKFCTSILFSVVNLTLSAFPLMCSYVLGANARKEAERKTKSYFKKGSREEL